ncbi:tetratricopeptide repeat protein [Magnetospira sp. QH-2]|uniref:tetratricopeptide repeat protein n=1 Tax=Magnetospira sp. (strain QH-2) TaxID=1288970 RepID=UPI0005FA720B|nr:tetratricopeptide repeat protein [Magnetospira sp. QH-2]
MHFLSRLMVRPPSYQDWSIRIAQLFLATNFMAAGYTALIDFGIIAPDNQLPAGIVATLPEDEILDFYTRGTSHFKAGDYATAYPLLHQAAMNGYPEAQFQISEIYAEGLGMEEDHCLATEWTDAAARNGHPEAQYVMGRALRGAARDRTGAASDSEQRLHWILEAAKNGDSRALEALDDGSAYDDWFLSAADAHRIKKSHPRWKVEWQHPERISRAPAWRWITDLGLFLSGRYYSC